MWKFLSNCLDQFEILKILTLLKIYRKPYKFLYLLPYIFCENFNNLPQYEENIIRDIINMIYLAFVDLQAVIERKQRYIKGYGY